MAAGNGDRSRVMVHQPDAAGLTGRNDHRVDHEQRTGMARMPHLLRDLVGPVPLDAESGGREPSQIADRLRDWHLDSAKLVEIADALQADLRALAACQRLV